MNNRKIHGFEIIKILYSTSMMLFIVMSYYSTIIKNKDIQTKLGRIITALTLIITVIIYFFNWKKSILINRKSAIFPIFILWTVFLLLDLIKGTGLRFNTVFVFFVFGLLTMRISRDELDNLVLISICFCVVICIVSLYLGIKGLGLDNIYVDMEWYHEIRLRGILDSPNGLGAYATMGILYFLFYKEYKWRWMPILICVITLYETKSKTCIASLIIILVIAISDYFFHWIRKMNFSKILSGIIFISLVVLIVIANNKMFTGRMRNWLFLISDLASNLKNIPFGVFSYPDNYHYAENMYIEALYSYGVVGFVLLLRVIGAIGNRCWKLYSKNNTYFYFFIFFVLRFVTESYLIGQSASIYSIVIIYLLLWKRSDIDIFEFSNEQYPIAMSGASTKPF